MSASKASPFHTGVVRILQQTLGPVPFTPEQHRQFAAHLLRVNARETCPLCDVDRWQLFLAGRLVERICQHCGLIVHFSTAVTGVEARQDGKEQ